MATKVSAVTPKRLRKSWLAAPAFSDHVALHALDDLPTQQLLEGLLDATFGPCVQLLRR